MNQNSFEVVDGIGHFRLSGAWRFLQAVQAISAAIAKADRLGLSRLLVVTTEATGFDPPSMADRHAMVRGWDQASMGPCRDRHGSAAGFHRPGALRSGCCRKFRHAWECLQQRIGSAGLASRYAVVRPHTRELHLSLLQD